MELTEESAGVPRESAILQMPDVSLMEDVSLPDAQPISPIIPVPVTTRSGTIVRRRP